MSVHFSSGSDDWSTPRDLFNLLDAEFKFDLDVAASKKNAKCPRFFTQKQDGLVQEWAGVCWMNPPYGRAIGEWVRKASESARAGATVVCLLPARTDTRWWHMYVTRASDVRFVRGRLKFGASTAGAPFPSAIVIFRPGSPRPELWTRGVFIDNHEPRAGPHHSTKPSGPARNGPGTSAAFQDP
ncbi:MAG: adenine methyltransferase [Phycisphaerales bacterium]|nr:adenine methyltransferase [Phycisphaerales bacterium]